MIHCEDSVYVVRCSQYYRSSVSPLELQSGSQLVVCQTNPRHLHNISFLYLSVFIFVVRNRLLPALANVPKLDRLFLAENRIGKVYFCSELHSLTCLFT